MPTSKGVPWSLGQPQSKLLIPFGNLVINNRQDRRHLSDQGAVHICKVVGNECELM